MGAANGDRGDARRKGTLHSSMCASALFVFPHLG